MTHRHRLAALIVLTLVAGIGSATVIIRPIPPPRSEAVLVVLPDGLASTEGEAAFNRTMTEFSVWLDDAWASPGSTFTVLHPGPAGGAEVLASVHVEPRLRLGRHQAALDTFRSRGLEHLAARSPRPLSPDARLDDLVVAGERLGRDLTRVAHTGHLPTRRLLIVAPMPSDLPTGGAPDLAVDLSVDRGVWAQVDWCLLGRGQEDPVLVSAWRRYFQDRSIQVFVESTCGGFLRPVPVSAPHRGTPLASSTEDTTR